MLGSVERAHDQAAGPKDQRADKHPAHQFGGELLLRRRKARRNHPLDQRQRKEGRQQRNRDQHDGHQGEHPAKEQPGRLLFALGPKGGKSGDERAAQCPAGDQLKEDIRHPKGGQIGIQLRTGAKLCADHHLARQTGHPAQDEKDHDHQGGAGQPPSAQDGGAVGLLLLRRRGYLLNFTAHRVPLSKNRMELTQ